MARIYIGDMSKVDPRVLREVETLPDDVWALAEFTLRRNYDWLIVCPRGDDPATLIVTEVKRLALPLRGYLNAPWEQQTPDGAWEPVPTSNPEDTNFYWQAVNSANSLSDWLRNNEPVFNEGESGVWSEARVWPDLLLLSPPGVRHRLPLRPDSGYGMWFFDVRRWGDHLRTWVPSLGPRLRDEHVERLVRYLGLTRYERPEGAEPVEVADAPDERLLDFQRSLAAMEGRVRRLEEVIEGMAAALSGGPARRPLPPRPRVPRPPLGEPYPPRPRPPVSLDS